MKLLLLVLLWASAAGASTYYCNSTASMLEYKENNRTLRATVRRPEDDFPGAVRQMYEEATTTKDRPELKEREDLGMTYSLDFETWDLVECHLDPRPHAWYEVVYNCSSDVAVSSADMKTAKFLYTLTRTKHTKDPEHGWCFDLENVGANRDETSRGVMNQTHTFLLFLSGDFEMRDCEVVERRPRRRASRRKLGGGSRRGSGGGGGVKTLNEMRCVNGVGDCDFFGFDDDDEEEECSQTWPVVVATVLAMIGLLALVTLCHKDKEQRVVVVDRVSPADESNIVKTGAPPAVSV